MKADKDIIDEITAVTNEVDALVTSTIAGVKESISANEIRRLATLQAKSIVERGGFTSAMRSINDTKKISLLTNALVQEYMDRLSELGFYQYQEDESPGDVWEALEFGSGKTLITVKPYIRCSPRDKKTHIITGDEYSNDGSSQLFRILVALEVVTEADPEIKFCVTCNTPQWGNVICIESIFYG